MTREELFDASTAIYHQIASLRRGLPIAEAKAGTMLKKMEVRKSYLARIQILDRQYKDVWRQFTLAPIDAE